MDNGQMMLKLFQDLSPEGKSIKDSPVDIGYNKNNLLCDLQDLNLNERRILEVCFFFVSLHNEPQKSYVLPESYFLFVYGKKIKDREYLRGLIKAGQKSTLTFLRHNEEDDFLSVQLLGAAGVWDRKVLFKVEEELQKQIQNPESHFYLSMLTDFNSVNSKVIYDRLQRYVSNEVTPTIELAEFRQWFTADVTWMAEYKELKRSVITPALKEISSTTKFTVTLQEQKIPGTKKVGGIKFFIKLADVNNDPTVNLFKRHKYYLTLREKFGVTDSGFQSIMHYPDERFEKAIELTEFRWAQKKVHSPGGFIVEALTQNWMLGELERAGASQLVPRVTAQPSMMVTPSIQGSTDAKKINHESVEAAYQKFLALSAQEKSMVWSAFNNSQAYKDQVGHRLLSVQEGEDQMYYHFYVRALFAEFYKQGKSYELDFQK